MKATKPKRKIAFVLKCPVYQPEYDAIKRLAKSRGISVRKYLAKVLAEGMELDSQLDESVDALFLHLPN